MKITNPYFVYDPNNGASFHASEAEALAEAQHILEGYRPDGDDSWPEDDLDMLVVGYVTHGAVQTNIVMRPDNLDEDNYDIHGTYWEEGVDSLCDYEMSKCDTPQDFVEHATVCGGGTR